jgi:hypothetical protein
MNLKNLHNEYQTHLEQVFHETPKAVLAAIACSAYEQIGFKREELTARIAYEWCALHKNGLVPNKPTKHIIQTAKGYDPLGE